MAVDIAVLGSADLDVVLRVATIPAPGGTAWRSAQHLRATSEEPS